MDLARVRAGVMLGGLAIAPLVVMLAPTDWVRSAPTICLFRNLTGMPCPGCGMGRAVHAVLHADWQAAWAFNPMVVVAFPLLVYAWTQMVSSAWVTWRRACHRDTNVPEPAPDLHS